MGKRSNGEGTIYKRKDERWCAAYFDAEFQRHYVYGKTQAEAKAKLKEKQNNPGEGGKKSKAETTLEEWVPKYLDNFKRNEVKETTYWNYLELYTKHVKGSGIGKAALSKLTGNQLQEF